MMSVECVDTFRNTSNRSSSVSLPDCTMSRRAVSLILGAAAALYALCEVPTARGHLQPPAMRRFLGSKAKKRLIQEAVANDQIQNAQVVDLDDGLRGDAIGPSASIRNSFSVSLEGSLAGASPDLKNSECGGSASSPSVWYSFRVPESNSSWSLTVDTYKSSLDTVMGLLSGACATANDTGCSCVGTNDNGCGRGTYGSRISSRVSGGSDFLALVRSYNSEETGTFELTLFATVVPPPSENDGIERAATVQLEREPTAARNSTLPRSTATVTVEGTLLSTSRDSNVCSERSGRAGVWYRVDINKTSALSVEVTSKEHSMRASVLKGSECLSSPSSPPCSCLTSRAMKEQTVVASPSAYLIWIFAVEDAAVDERRSAFTLTLAVSVLPPPPENDGIERAATVQLEREPTAAGNSTLPRSTATVTVEGTLLSASSDSNICSERSGRAGVWYRVDVNETSALSVEVTSKERSMRTSVLKGSECLSSPSSPPCSCVTDWIRSARAVRASQSTYFMWVFVDDKVALLDRTSTFNRTVSLAVLPPPPANTVIE
uniref:Uncharacterized protein n=1 Tax=Chromera velia CCMP2878 TaxID=1169474 RepID=A0A0G4HR24_9ALVE|eukprot:Cvel_30464.t1-p1 / transcript=Cvel_30464.t1 / gene=Cvel_30464 / organism=Chromera_velia_CCMP2878 / gene_product=hypothetical protein / transcript_product=hypothetical protein / location=Cvel_scaffold4345:6354-8895(-) / protein_length=546 / sequence_SO=supercontig / SO=protein_coding / is_pseudo=false